MIQPQGDLKEATREEPLTDAMMRTGLLKIITGPIVASVKKREFQTYKEMREYIMKGSVPFMDLCSLSANTVAPNMPTAMRASSEGCRENGPK